MQSIDRPKFAVLMVIHLLWGSVLWFSISKLGLGLSTDSVHLLFAGTDLADGRGLISFDGSPVILWPPLYPALLAAVHLLTGLSTFAAAHILQVAAFLALSVCLSILCLRIFPDDFLLALAGTLLSDIGSVVVAAFGMVGSDYLELFLAVLCALLLALYLEHPSRRLYVAVFLVAMLAMLQRYLGVAAIAASMLGILLWSGGRLGQRLLRSGFLALAALPAASWLAQTAPLITRRAPVSLAQNFGWFASSILGWFLPAGAIQAHPVLYIALLCALVALIAFALWAGRRSVPLFAAPLLLFGILYTLALFGSASIAYYNRLEGRFLLPLYIPFVIGLLLALHVAVSAVRSALPARYRAARLASFGALALLGILLLSVSMPAVAASHAGLAGPGDNVFNTLAWRDNRLVRYWQAHRPAGSYILLSNQPDGVAFFAAHACDASPRRRAGPYATVEYPLESYAPALFAAGQPVYLVWIEPEARSYYYRPEDLSAIADLQVLDSGPGGAIYRLTPKPGG